MDTKHEIKFYQSGKPFCTCGAHGERVFERNGQWVCEEAEAREALAAQSEPDYLQQVYELACQNKQFDPRRLARALALAQDARTQRAVTLIGWVIPTRQSYVFIPTHNQTVGGCSYCKDIPGQSKNEWCKHKLCAALLEKASELEANAKWIASLPDAKERAADVLALYGEA